MSGFWRTWLWVWCGAVALFGLVLTGAAFEATSGPTRLLFGILSGSGELALDGPLRFSVALLGAVTLGWSVTLLAAILAALRLGDQGGGVWRLITGSVALWYVVDSLLSIATGFGLNAVPNTVIIAAFLLPVLRAGVLARSRRV